MEKTIKGKSLFSIILVALLATGCETGEKAPETTPTPTPTPEPSPSASASPRSWGEPIVIDRVDGYVYDFSLAIDDGGNGLAVWRQFDEQRSSIWWSRYTHASGWGRAELLETFDTYCWNPRVACNGSGQAVAAWISSTTSTDDVYACVFSPETGWSQPSALSTSHYTATSPRVEMNDAGKAVVIWRQVNSSGIWAVFLSQYVPGTGWGTTGALTSNSDDGIASADIALNSSGTEEAVFIKDDGVAASVYARRYNPLIGSWTFPASLLEHDSAGDAFPAYVAMDDEGNFAVLWKSMDKVDHHYDIWANRFSGGGLGDAELMETSNSISTDCPALCMNASGRGLAAWLQASGTTRRICARLLDPSSGWGETETIQEISGEYGSLSTDIDDAGSCFAAWLQKTGAYWDAYASRRGPDGWGTSELLETSNVGDVNGIEIATNASGSAIVLWTQDDGQCMNLWARAY